MVNYSHWFIRARLKTRQLLLLLAMEEEGNIHRAAQVLNMKKRAGLARAIASQPPLIFLDEPSAGLDPISSKRLDDLVLMIRERTGAAVVFVSHELPSLFAIADDGIFLDAESKSPIAHGSPSVLRDTATHPTVRAFLAREEPPPPVPSATTPTTATPWGDPPWALKVAAGILDQTPLRPACDLPEAAAPQIRMRSL